MKTGWKLLMVAGVLALVSSQVLAQPWRGGPGWGPGPAQRAGRPNWPGMGLRPYGPGPMGLGGPRGGPGTWRPPEAGQRGRGAWSPLERGQAGIPGLFAGRLGLTDEQKQKIRTITDEARSKTLASIKEVLTDEQVKQLEQMQGKARQFGQRMREPGPRDRFGNPRGSRPQRGEGPGDQMQPLGRGRPGQPFGGGQGRGRDSQSQMGPQQPGTPGQPPANGPRPGAGRSWNRGTPPPEQMSDEANANKDGRRPQRGEGQGDQMQPGRRGRPGQPFGGGQGRAPDPQSQMGPQRPSTPWQPPANGPRPGAGRSWNRGTPPLEQMSDEANANKDGRRLQRGEGQGDQMQPLGRGRPGQPFGGGQGRGRDPQSQMGPQQPGTPGQPPANGPGPGAERSWNRGNPPLEQIFDEADTNKDGALTKEELRVFHDARRGNQPSGQQ